MPLPVPNLDDRTFDQLTAEARALIPKNFPTWTDHNLSDPGITLLELFAFLIEAAIYQVNRVPERSLEHFAKLVDEARQRDPVSGKPEPIEQTLRRALEGLKPKYRAITEDEFETLAKQAEPETIARAKSAIKVVDTPNVFPNEQFVKVIIVPNEPENPCPVPTGELRQRVFEFLRSRRLITTRAQVVPPDCTRVRVAATIVRGLASRLDGDTVKERAKQAISGFLSPLRGGIDRTGWEFGRSVFRSELFQVIEGVDGVDHVHRLLLNDDDIVGELPLSSPISLVRLDELTVIVVDM